MVNLTKDEKSSKPNDFENAAQYSDEKVEKKKTIRKHVWKTGPSP